MKILSIIIAVIGFYITYKVWTKKTVNKKGRISKLTISWGLIMASYYLMVKTYGIEYGLTYALFGLSVVPLGIILLNLEIRSIKKDKKKPYKSISITTKKLVINVLNFIIIIPVSFTLSAVSSLLISQQLSWQTVNQLTLVVILFPLLWALILYFYLYTEKRKSSAIKIMVLTATTVLLARP